MEKDKQSNEDALVVRIVDGYFQDSKQGKLSRMDRNRQNFDMYNMEQDFTHKTRGQSKEFLPKQSLAVEQTTSFIQQALIDVGKFYDVKKQPWHVPAFLDENDIYKILDNQLHKNKITQLIPDAIKLALLGSLMIFKVRSCSKEVTRFVAERKFQGQVPSLLKKTRRVSELKIDLVRQQDYYPDPTGRGLYEIEEIEMDYHELVRMAEENPGIYDMSKIEMVKASGRSTIQEQEKARETNQDPTAQSSRKPIIVREFWGSLVDPATGKLIHENVVCATANNILIRKPEKNPWWHGESPYIACPILRVPHSVWHKALTDAGTKLNMALNEVYNLMLDGGMQAVFGIRQIREDWIDNMEDYDNGIPPGATIKANTKCPPGAKVMERVDTSAVPNDGLAIYNLTDRELLQSLFTNDISLGNLPQRAVKATEIISSQNSITGLFAGNVKIIESEGIGRVLQKSWAVIAQIFSELNKDEISILLPPEKRSRLAVISSEEVFADTYLNNSFKVFGLSQVLAKINDFQKIAAMLQTIGSSPEMMNEFMKKYSLTKLFGEIIKSLDIDESKILMDQQEQLQRAAELILAQQQAEQEQPDNMSQIPKVSNMPDQSVTPAEAAGGVSV